MNLQEDQIEGGRIMYFQRRKEPFNWWPLGALIVTLSVWALILWGALALFLRK